MSFWFSILVQLYDIIVFPLVNFFLRGGQDKEFKIYFACNQTGTPAFFWLLLSDVFLLVTLFSVSFILFNIIYIFSPNQLSILAQFHIPMVQPSLPLYRYSLVLVMHCHRHTFCFLNFLFLFIQAVIMLKIIYLPYFSYGIASSSQHLLFLSYYHLSNSSPVFPRTSIVLNLIFMLLVL